MSTLFDAEISEGEVVIRGFGFGHGVGMSQYGTMDYADNGWDYKSILKHYYSGVEIKQIYGYLPAAPITE